MLSQLKNLIQRFVKRFSRAKKPLSLVAIVIVMVMVISMVMLPRTAQASWFADAVVTGFNAGFSLLSFIVNVAIFLLGKLLITVMGILVILSTYNKFIDNPYVNEGWVILRDLVNMFFVLGLLFIAFVTVLKIEKYQWNKLLGRLLVMAILVNFSKTICGLIIDFFQVIMITFVNAYKDITSGNITQALGVTNWFKSAPPPGVAGGKEQDWSSGITALAGSLLGLIYVIVTLVVVVIFCVILAFRMIALWILVVFSPLAFFAWSFEGAAGKVSSFANQWWDQFFNYCLVGPCIAFFLWISLLTMVKLNPDMMFEQKAEQRKQYGMEQAIGPGASTDNLLSIIMGIIMLVAGLQTCSKYAGAGAGMMTKAANSIKDSTAGRLERTATGMGQRAVGAVKGVAKAPIRAVTPYFRGAAEGVKERLQRGRFSRLLTKEGRGEAAAAMEARGKAPFVGGLARRDMRAKQAADYKNIRKDINWDNPDQVRKIFDDEIKTGGKDRRLLEAATTSLADKGKLDYKDINNLSKTSLFAEMDKDPKSKEKQVFLEDMENRFEKETGRKKAFSSLVYNEDTNQYEDVSDLERKAISSGKNAKDNAGNNVDLSELPMHKIAKKVIDKNDKDFGKYKLDTNSAEFKNSTVSQQQALQNLAAGGIQEGSDFYKVARFSDVIEKKQGEVRKKMATSNREQFNKASKQADFGDPTKNDKYTGVEMDGGVEQISRVSGIDQGARDNWKAKIEARFSRGADRIKVIEANKQWFSNDLQRKDGEGDQDYINRLDGHTDAAGVKHDGLYSSLDSDTDNMDEEKLVKYQNFYKESTYKYDDFGRKQPGSTPLENNNISDRLRNARLTGGISGGIDKQMSGYSLPSASHHAQDVVTVNNEAADILASTESFDDRNDRLNQIVTELQAKTSLRGPQATDMANYLLDNEIKIKVRAQATRGVQANVRVKIEAIADEADRQKVKGAVNIPKLDLMINSVMNKIDTEIIQGGLSETALDPNALRVLLDNLKINLQAAATPTAFRAALKRFRQDVASLGYKEGS